MKFVSDCIGKLKGSNRGYIAILLAVLAPIVMAMFYIYIKESHSNLNQTAINLATKEAALAVAGNYYDGDAIAFKSQQQFLDRKATTVFNSLMKIRVGLKSNVIPMKRNSVMYSESGKQDGVTDFLSNCQRRNASEYDPDFEYMRPISIAQHPGQDWSFYAKYAQRRSASSQGSEYFYTKDSSAGSDNVLRIEKIDSDKIKVYADIHLDADGHGKRYTAEYTAKAPVCDVDIVIGVPVNKNLSQKAKEISDALRTFVKNWLPVRGCAIGVVPYSGKVGVYAGSQYYNSSKASGEENQLSIPISDSYKYLGSNGGSLYARNISQSHHGVAGLMFDFDKFSKDGNLKDKLFELITSNIFRYVPVNVCYGGNVSVATGRCRENTKNYQYACPMVGLTYDLLSVHKYLGLLNDGFNDSSSFLYLPIMFGMAMLKEGYTPPLLDGFSDIDHINDDDTKKVAIIIANQADRFEHHELTYFGYNNDAAHVSMIDGDKLDFENGNIVYVGNGYLANSNSYNKHSEYYKNARIKTTYNVTDKNHCEKGDVVIPTKQNMRFILASLPFVRIYRRNGHFDEVEVTNVTSNGIVLTKDEYFQCFVPPGEDTQLNISYSGNKPVLVKVEFFECEARGEPSGHYLRQDTDYVYICRKGMSVSGSARLGVYQTKEVNNAWWALAYCDNHLLGTVNAPGDEGRHNSCTYNYTERKSTREVKACNARLSCVSTFKCQDWSIINDIFTRGEVCKVACKEWHSDYGNREGHNVFCVRPGRERVHKSIPTAVLPDKYGDDQVLYYSDLNVTFKRTDATFDSSISYQNEMKGPSLISLRSNPQSSSDTLVLVDGTSDDISYSGNIDIGTIELEPFQPEKSSYASCQNEKCPWVWNLFCGLGSAEITSSSIKVHYNRTIDVECKNVGYDGPYPHTVVVKSDARGNRSGDKYSVNLSSCVDGTVRTVKYEADGISVTHYVKSLRAEILTKSVTREPKTIQAYSYARVYTNNGHSNAVITSVTATNGGVVVPGTDCFDCYVTSTGGAEFSVRYSDHTDTTPVIARAALYGSEIESCGKTIMQDESYVYACGKGSSGSFSISLKPIEDSSEMIQHPPLSYCNNELYRSGSAYHYDAGKSELKLQNLYNVSVSTIANGTYSDYLCEASSTKHTGDYYADRKCTWTESESSRTVCRAADDSGVSFDLPSDGILRYTGLTFSFTFRDRTWDEKGHNVGCIKDPNHCSFRRPLGANVIINGTTHKFRNGDRCNGCEDDNCQNRSSDYTFSIPSPDRYKGKRVQVMPYLGGNGECMYSHWGNNRYACFGFLKFRVRVDYTYNKQKSGGNVDVESKASFGMSKKDSYESTAASERNGRVITYTLYSAGNPNNSTVNLDCNNPKNLSYSMEIKSYNVRRNTSSIVRQFRKTSKGNIYFTSGYSGPKRMYDLEKGYTQIYIPKEHLTGTTLSFSVNNVFVSAIEWCNVLTTKNNTYLERVKDATASSLISGNPPYISYEKPRVLYNVELDMSGGRDVTGIGKLNIPYGSDLNLIFEDRYDAEDRIVSLSSEKYGYLNGLNRYFRGCFNEKGGINAGITSGGRSPVYLFSGEYTLPVNQILQACYGQKANNNNVNETPTDIMRNKVAVDACKKFVQTFKKNGRLYIVKYLNPKDKNYSAESAAFNKLKVDNSGVLIYEATNPKELSEAMNDILSDIENFAGYRGAKIVDR